MDENTATFPATLFVVDDDAEARRGVFALAASLGLPCRGFSSAEELLQRISRNGPGACCSTCGCRAWMASPCSGG